MQRLSGHRVNDGTQCPEAELTLDSNRATCELTQLHAVQAFLDRLDHSHLNDHQDIFKGAPTTAEVISQVGCSWAPPLPHTHTTHSWTGLSFLSCVQLVHPPGCCRPPSRKHTKP